PPGEQRAARRRARRLGIARRQSKAVARQRIDHRRGRADGDATAVAPEIAPSDVVEEDDQEIGAPTCARRVGRELLPRGPLLVRMVEGRLTVRGDADSRARDRIEGWHAETLCTDEAYFKRVPAEL